MGRRLHGSARRLGRSEARPEGLEQSPALWPVAESARGIDVPERARLDEAASPLSRPRARIFGRGVWIVVARDDQ